MAKDLATVRGNNDFVVTSVQDFNLLAVNLKFVKYFMLYLINPRCHHLLFLKNYKINFKNITIITEIGSHYIALVETELPEIYLPLLPVF